MTRRVWLLLALLPLGVLAIWIVTGEHGIRELPLLDDGHLSTRSAAYISCIGLSATCVACAFTARAGLVALGVMLLGIAVFWPLLQDTPYAGSILWSRGSHGIHANDWWAIVPAVLGVLALHRAWKQPASAGPVSGSFDDAAEGSA